VDKVAYRKKICGNVIPLPTPFHADFSLDLAALRRVVGRLIKAGYRTGNAVLLVGAAGGEFFTLHTDERKKVAEAVVEEAAGSIPVIVGAQHTSTLIVLELARFAKSIGADGIQVGPPYYETMSSDDVFELFRTVSDSVDIPMMVYNTVHAAFGYEQTARVLELANVGALKWSAPAQYLFEAILRDFAQAVCIVDNQLCEILSHMMGATAFVSHLPLMWPAYGLRLWDCLQQKRYAEALELIQQLRIPYYMVSLKAYTYTASESILDKAILEMMGEPIGPARPPARPLPPEILEEIRQKLPVTEYTYGKV
jgi:dihydrodipicolinate synthase/N-acetylneuraminate lyase